jgi:hypothetical protein
MAMMAAQIELGTKQALQRKAEADAAKAEAEAMMAGAQMQAGQPQMDENGQPMPAQAPAMAAQPQAAPAAPQIAVIDPRVNDIALEMQSMRQMITEVANVIQEIAPPVMEGMHGPDGTREPTQKETLMAVIGDLKDTLAAMMAAQATPKTVTLARDARGQVTGGTVAPVDQGMLN